jgi:hypothetical protein
LCCLSLLHFSPTDYGDADGDDGNYTDAEGDTGSEVDEKEDHEERTNEVDDHDDDEATERHRTAKPAVTCGPERGGCDHECRVVSDPETRIECSCYSGFLLDQSDQRTCHGELMKVFVCVFCE